MALFVECFIHFPSIAPNPGLNSNSEFSRLLYRPGQVPSSTGGPGSARIWSLYLRRRRGTPTVAAQGVVAKSYSIRAAPKLAVDASLNATVAASQIFARSDPILTTPIEAVCASLDTAIAASQVAAKSYSIWAAPKLAVDAPLCNIITVTASQICAKIHSVLATPKLAIDAVLFRRG